MRSHYQCHDRGNNRTMGVRQRRFERRVEKRHTYKVRLIRLVMVALGFDGENVVPVVSNVIDRHEIATVTPTRPGRTEAGVVLMVTSALTVAAIGLRSASLVGWLMIAAGGVIVAQGIPRRETGGRVLTAASGLLYIITGLLIIVHPEATPLARAFLVAGFLVVQGIVRLLAAVIRASGATLAHAITCMLLGFVTGIWAQAHLVVAMLLGMAGHRWTPPGLRVIGLFIVVDMLLAGWPLLASARSAVSSPRSGPSRS
jgi:uncharacterized membrane protein HdeD (DUF308 family)